VRLVRALVAGAGAALLVTTTVALSPSAAAAPSSAPARVDCIAQPSGTDRPPAMRCFATFAQAVAAATGGAVELPPGTPVGRLPLDALAANRSAAARASTTAPAAVPMSSYITSVDYTGADYTGNALVWYQSAPCGSFASSAMPAGWNDVVSSVAAYSGCGTTLYADAGFGGGTYSIGVDGSASSLGSFNDEASSQRWCTSALC
jgi:hypothetical protein